MSRLYILASAEQKAFDTPPGMPIDIQRTCFVIDGSLEKQINQLRASVHKVGFLLQCAYFKACKRFFLIDRFPKDMIIHAAKLLNIHDVTNLSSYKNNTPLNHQKIILKLFDHAPFDEDTEIWLKKEMDTLIKQQVEPKQIFNQSLDRLRQHKIEVPTYHRLAEMITAAYVEFEDDLLLTLHKKMKKSDEKLLDALLEIDGATSQAVYTHFRVINQSSKPKATQASLAQFTKIKTHFLALKPIIDTLDLLPSTSEYYATWVQKAKLSQLKQMPDKHRVYLYLLAFIQHQFYLRQDYFVDLILKSVQSTRGAVSKKLSEADSLTRTERRKAIRYLSKSHHKHRDLISEIQQIAKSPALSDKEKVETINALLDAHEQQKDDIDTQKIELYEKTLSAMAKDEDYFNALEKLSIKLQRRISHIMLELELNEGSSDKNIMIAIHHFREKEGQITEGAPTDFMSSEERTMLIDKEQKFRPSLYKALLFLHIADGIKSGTVNLHYSYRYKSIYDYLIDEKMWKEQRTQLIRSAGLEDFADFQKTIDTLKIKLDGKYASVNERFIEKRNPYLFINDKKVFHVKTPAIEEQDKEYTAALLEQAGYIPVLQVLTQIEEVSQFTDCFKHHSIKHVKQRPGNETFFSGLMALGCNIGIRKMAKISLGVKENTLLNTTNWYFSLKNLQAANQRIVALINKLSLPSIFIHEKEKIHSSSDGQKMNVSVESLIASYSFKYFGKDKGVSVYTFLDERQALFHSLVMSSAEREAAYVIDGLNHNEVTKTHIHSTDTHGFTEVIFGTTHFLGIAFAPRIKNIGEQRIYAFQSTKSYEVLGYQILPERAIHQNIISKNWDDILRFMVTIKLKVTTASQLFKRLSSYAKENPLYKALKEFGRIIKSIFILTYYDDVTLRQRIEKQLSHIELSNRFSKAIFFADNSEFKQPTREEQEIATACKVLIQNAIVLWNYLYLSQLLSNCRNDEERNEMVGMIKHCTVMIWRHINLHGEYDFRRQAANDTLFDMAKILSLKVV